MIGIGDPAASLIGPRLYREFVWPFEKRLVSGLRAMGARVRLHICGNTRGILDLMGALGCDIVDIDSLVPVAGARHSPRLPPTGGSRVHRGRRVRDPPRHPGGECASYAGCLRAASVTAVSSGLSGPVQRPDFQDVLSAKANRAIVQNLGAGAHFRT